MSRRDHVSVGDESSPTSAGLLRLRGSQEQQSRPWKLICLRFFSANTLELIMNILSSLHFTFWPINVTQKGSKQCQWSNIKKIACNNKGSQFFLKRNLQVSKTQDHSKLLPWQNSSFAHKDSPHTSPPPQWP